MASLSILIVQSGPLDALKLAEALQADGHVAELVADFDRARAWLTDTPPDLVIVDALIGDSDAMRFVQAVQADPAWQAVPIIIGTEYPVYPREQAGCIICRHPFELTELRETLAGLPKRAET